KFQREYCTGDNTDFKALIPTKIDYVSKKNLRIEYPSLMKGLREYAKNSLRKPNTQYAIIQYSEGTYYGRVDQENKRHGKGTFVFNDKSYYKGLWSQDVPYCCDCFRENDTKMYRGFFDSNGKRGGQGSKGKTYFLNGDTHEGFYLKGEYDDVFTYFWKGE
ncbi:MAG: hypothetical protein ACKO96_44035, partial [Flammeovirgaceae bacterium]